MGGYGSSRWGTTVTRITTEGLPRLDVRALAHKGCLQPGTLATIAWDNGATVTTEVTLACPDVITLDYCASDPTGSWLPIHEDVSLTRTPCTFGSSRVWFACPGCGIRCAILYALGSRFRCRGCHHIAYASTRTVLISHHTRHLSPSSPAHPDHLDQSH